MPATDLTDALRAPVEETTQDVPGQVPEKILPDIPNTINQDPPHKAPEAPLENMPQHIPDNEADNTPDLPPKGEHQDIPSQPPIDDATQVWPSNDLASEKAHASHHEIFSSSTFDKKFFYIDMGEFQTMNPNIIPHPTLEDTWIVVAQQIMKEKMKFAELICNAVFQGNVLRCTHPPSTLPVTTTKGGRCEGDISYFNAISGPRDARVFLGPSGPYIIYGSNSEFTCLGQFIQDLRSLAPDWNMDPQRQSGVVFAHETELQRPPPWQTLEKNWFLFWDASGQMHVHHDIAPKRSFAQLDPDGSVGHDLGPSAGLWDEKCTRKFMPQLPPKLESIHQATNSLRITFCRRADPTCVPNESNTFIFIIYQHKTYYHYHSVYEPYVILFQQRAPYEIYAMSRRPIWIHGRERHPERDTSDMFYVTSMNWKQQGLNYHGYLDDVLMLAFGVEDERAAGIDVRAEDLLGDLGLCNEP